MHTTKLFRTGNPLGTELKANLSQPEVRYLEGVACGVSVESGRAMQSLRGYVEVNSGNYDCSRTLVGLDNVLRAVRGNKMVGFMEHGSA